MKKLTVIILTLGLTFWALPAGFAQEHGGTAMPQEHGGTAMEEEDGAMMNEEGGTETHEHGGAAEVKTPSADDIHAVMKKYIEEESQRTGTFNVVDPQTGTTQKLTLERIHERVGKTGDYYYSCADFKDTVSGELVDLDLDVKEENGQMGVVDVRIHKVDGEERYTYDGDDNRIPVPATE